MSTIIPRSDGSPFDHLKQTDDQGREFWSARDLQKPMGYDRWERFEAAIERAIAACENSGSNPRDHFRGSTKKVSLGSTASRALLDWHLTRYASYLVAMNGDPRKAEVAAAQTYFAVKAREAEVAQSAPQLPQDFEGALVALLGQVRENKELSAKVAALGPDAFAWERLASANGDFSVRVAANILNRDPSIATGQNRLFDTIRSLRMVDKRDIPYAAYNAHLRLKPGAEYEHPHTGEKKIGDPQVRVTIRGLQYLHKKLGGTVAIAHHVQAEMAFDSQAGAA